MLVAWKGELVSAALISKGWHFVSPGKLTVVTLLAAFVWLVGNGVTGSSLGMGIESTDLIARDMRPLLGKPRPIRSDEWLVSTPLAIGQYNHSPQFPVINKNLGPDGQNMLVVTMTGVPVTHISALGRPATWGFFVFDLKRALAWYWWLPIFGCLLSLWALFSKVFRLDWRFGLGLSALFTFSPYATAWSFWPAYLVMFPSLGLVALVNLLNATSIKKTILWGMVFGFSLLGFIFILYPAWQVTVGYLFIFLLLGVFIRDKLYRLITFSKLAIIAVAVLLVMAVCYLWWMDARDAIAAMMATVYPGQRAAVTGGSLSPWFMVKGLISPFSLFSGKLPNTNESESASFVYLLFPLGCLALINVIKNRKLDPILGSMVVFIALALFYQYFGFSDFVTKITLWGRTAPERVDLSLGLAQIMLIAYLIASSQKQKDVPKSKVNSWLILFLIATLAVTAYFSMGMPPGWRIKGVYIAAIIGVCLTLLAAYALYAKKHKVFMGAMLLWTLPISLAFNPFSIAPRDFKANLPGQESDQDSGARRVLFIGNQVPAMMLMASGVPVLTGVFFYPQKSLWKILDPNGAQTSVHNRYQHLIFLLNEKQHNQASFIRAPQPDLVYVDINGASFNFDSLPIDYVISDKQSGSTLLDNPSLRYKDETNNDLVFDVRAAR